MSRFRWLAAAAALAVLAVPVGACGDGGGSGGSGGSAGSAGGESSGGGSGDSGAAEAPPFPVGSVTETFVDDSRTTDDPVGDRSAPTRTLQTTVYVPGGTGPFPMVVLAHGFSCQPRKFRRLATAWAEAGYMVAIPAFPLTNDRSGGPPVLADLINQPADVSFVIDELLRLGAGDDPALGGRVDGEHIGLAGHSLGGATAYGVAFNGCCPDERLDAVVLMSTLPLPFGDDPFTFEGVPALLLQLTGDPIVPYQQAVDTYDRLASPRFLVTLEGGGHVEPYEDALSPHDEVVTATTIAFWDAYLGDDPAAADRLVEAADAADATRVTADP
jgi:dienelactone hydrolase